MLINNLYFRIIVETPFDIGELELYETLKSLGLEDQFFMDLVTIQNSKYPISRIRRDLILDLYYDKIVLEEPEIDKKLLDKEFRDINRFLEITMQDPTYKPNFKQHLSYAELGKLVIVSYDTTGTLTLCIVPKGFKGEI